MKKLIIMIAFLSACTALWAGLSDGTGLFGTGLFGRRTDGSDTSESGASESAFQMPPVSFAADAGIIQDYFSKTGSCQINADIRLDISPIFQLRVPVNVTIKKSMWMADCGLMIAGYPIENCGFNAGVNLIQAGYRQGKYFALNEIVAGWTIKFKDRYFAEPQIAVRDPSGAFKDEYAEILGIFPCYKNIRVRLLCGISL